jgi:hypothetical protein
MSAADFPSPTHPMKGRVPSGERGNIAPQTQDGTSPFMGEVGRGQSTAYRRDDGAEGPDAFQ